MPASNAEQRRTGSGRPKFLALLARGASVTAAAQAAGLGRTALYQHRAEDPAFAAAWVEAEESGTDALEDEALRRAVRGVLEPKFWKGAKCGNVRKYSDGLLALLLKARRPAKYREGIGEETAKTLADASALMAVLEAGRARAGIGGAAGTGAAPAGDPASHGVRSELGGPPPTDGAAGDP